MGWTGSHSGGRQKHPRGRRCSRRAEASAPGEKNFHPITDRSRNGQRPGFVWEETAAFTPVAVWGRLVSCVMNGGWGVVIGAVTGPWPSRSQSGSKSARDMDRSRSMMQTKGRLLRTMAIRRSWSCMNDGYCNGAGGVVLSTVTWHARGPVTQ